MLAYGMRQLEPVLWTKGVLLTPQHLQTQDRHFSDLLAFQLAALTGAAWGFGRLEIDLEALAAGSFALGHAAGIFPDGLPFELPASDPLPEPRPLGAAWEPDQAELDLYLAVPDHRIGGQNVSTGAGSRSTRYRAEMVALRDENTGLMEKPVQVARRNLRLLTGNESLEGCSTLRVGRVRRSSTGAYELDPGCIPPLLNYAASPALIALTRRLVEILSARSTALAALRRQHTKGRAQFGAQDTSSFWLLYTINTHLPEIRHLFQTRWAHPAALHRALAALGGALTTFSRTVHPSNMPDYDHADPGPSLARLDAIVRDLLETVIPARYIGLPLVPIEGGIHAAAIDRDDHFRGPQWYLAVSASVGAADLIQRVPQNLKVASVDGLDRLIRRSLPGLVLQHAPEPPAALPIKLNHQYFHVERSGAEWEAVLRSRKLGVFVSSDLPDAHLELLIVLPE